MKEGAPQNDNFPSTDKKERILGLVEELRRYESEEGDEAIVRCVEIYNELDELDPDLLENLKR